MSATSDSTLADPQQIIADLKRQLAESNAERDEALGREAASAEVLQVINSSPGDLAPVFDAMLDKALQLCGAAFGILHTIDGERSHIAAHRGVSPTFAEFLTGRPHEFSKTGPGLIGQLLRGERVIHHDAAESEGYRSGAPIARALVELEGGRSVLAVPLSKDNALLGMFVIYRREVRPFSDKQITLLENFAAQAVIAMENARLLTETREALEQQTATAEVLGVINSSPSDLTPVFNAILEKAHGLCGITFGTLQLYDGEKLRAVATRGLPEPQEKVIREPYAPELNSPLQGLIDGGRFVQFPDLAERDTQVPNPRSRIAVGLGIRTLLFLPLRKDNLLLGLISAARTEAKLFSEREIALLENFAAQAVIAMENARLITETREALEQQTATAEVLQVINSSPGDLAPVFDAILEKAHSLCGATKGALVTYDGAQLRGVATRGLSERYAVLVREQRDNPPGSPRHRLLSGERIVHIPDCAAIDLPIPRAAFELEGVRTVLFVPLRKDGVLLGYITAYRQEVRPFSDKQIRLLENFAAQAVIAMENARLITETREALEQQTATAEVLGVINSSPGDLAPVFDVILEKATRLCEAAFGLMSTYDGERYHTVATHGVGPQLAEFMRAPPLPDPESALGRIERGEDLVLFDDIADTDVYRKGDPRRRAIVDLGGAHSYAVVALRKDRKLLGIIAAYRREVRPFSDKQVALLQNFAAQAVIAIENARLINETREALEQQTATAEILEIINRSPGDLAPVFDAIVEKAHSLCGAAHGTLMTYDGEYARAVATHGVSEPLAGLLHQPFRPLPNSPHARLVREQCVVHISDLEAEPLWERDDPKRIATTEGGVRTMLFVPLRKDDVVLGWIAANRPEVRPFSDKEIALLESFAAQAVIAMENARLLAEVHQRQAELRVTFDNMGDGVVMFDEELRLAAWNRNFQELLDLPDAVLAERPRYADYLGILAERGEFGTDDIEAELSRRLDEIDQELRLERTRPDGRVIEVRRNAVPGGGFVLIYSDITERKRSEAEIRAARDAAEAAYADLKAAQANLIQAEKMASLGQLTAGIAHEIKNPLNFVNNFASLSNELLDELKDEAEPALATLADDKRAEIDETLVMLSGNLEKIAEHGKRADNIVKSMLEHSRGVSGERREVDLNNLIDEALKLAYHGARAQDQSFNISLERDYARGLKPIELAPQEITRAFLNLFGNGFYAANKRARANGDGSFHPVLTVVIREAEDAVEVRVRDNGTGIPPEIRDKLFQPFFTTTPTGEGTGLGLSISWDIVTQQHGGTITVESEPGSFTEFTVRLPRN
jgi:GAF domain-containing protein